jgi:hypothetical protein
MKKLLLITAIALTGCLSGPETCEQGMVDIYTQSRYISHGNYEKTDFNTMRECEASVEATQDRTWNPEPGAHGPNYCTAHRQLGCTNMSVGGK